MTTARKISETTEQTLWFVEWPSIPMRKQGKTYYATTFRGSDELHIETAAKRQKVAPRVEQRIAGAVRHAIANAK